MSGKIALKLVALLLVISLLGALGWYIPSGDTHGPFESVDDDGMEDDNSGEDVPSKVPPAGSGLATPFLVGFSDPEYQLNPLDYTLPLTSDDIENLGSFGMTDAQLTFLLSNGMVGLSGTGGTRYNSFFAAYEQIQERSHQPTFITSDSILDAYHHIFEGALIELEQDELTEHAMTLADRLMWASDSQVASLPFEGQELARQNVVFFGVALRIFDPEADIPDYAEREVGTIIDMIEAASGTLKITGFHQQEDFTQYKPRGHYTRSEELGRYFKGMMWFGRITFQGQYDDETRRAVLIAVALKNDRKAWVAYKSMSNVIDFMVGQPDDLTPYEVITQVDEVLGPMDCTSTPLFDDDKLDLLQQAIGALRAPKISSDVVRENGTVWGMRVFGQRYVPDSYIFQQCVYDEVLLENRRIEDQRLMPTCIDVFAALGSEEAWDREDFATFAPALEDQLTAIREEFDTYPDEVWSSTLYWSWLHSLKSLHESVQEERGPAFMQTRAWSAKELNAQAASWTQLTHDTILYRKQSYTILITSLPPPPSDLVYVEPVPILYSRLGDMVEATMKGLKALGFDSERVYGKLERYASTLELLERVALAELEGKGTSEEDAKSLKYFYETLESLNKMGEGEEDTKTILVSDVHTDPNNEEVLQEGVGPVRMMLVVIPTEHGNYVAVGAVFEHHEFAWPMSNRLTDEEWTTMLEDDSAPDPAPWYNDFNP